MVINNASVLLHAQRVPMLPMVLQDCHGDDYESSGVAQELKWIWEIQRRQVSDVLRKKEPGFCQYVCHNTPPNCVFHVSYTSNTKMVPQVWFELHVTRS